MIKSELTDSLPAITRSLTSDPIAVTAELRFNLALESSQNQSELVIIVSGEYWAFAPKLTPIKTSQVKITIKTIFAFINYSLDKIFG